MTMTKVAEEFGLHPDCFRMYLKEHEPELHASLGMKKTENGGIMAPHSMGKYAEALQLYSTTTESIKSLARRFGFNDCSFGQFIRRHFPELHEQHKELVRQMKEAD
jgi:transposase-like protein